MLFEELDKIKRSVVMAAIVLAAAGCVLLVLPYEYVAFLGWACGFALLVAFAHALLAFAGSKRTLVSYFRLTFGIVLGLLGMPMLFFEGFFFVAVWWLVGTVPILLGGFGIYYALTFVRRSGRAGWWVLLVLAVALFGVGGFVFWNPWMENPSASIQVAGGVLLTSAIVSALSLVWVWPARNAEGEEA